MRSYFNHVFDRRGRLWLYVVVIAAGTFLALTGQSLATGSAESTATKPAITNTTAVKPAIVKRSVVKPTATKTTLTHQRIEPTIRRLSGSNAINTSVAVSVAYYSPSVPVAYIVNRAAYADGVVASSMKADGPILYVNTDSLPNAVATELKRLKPRQVIVVGGESIVSKTVFQGIKLNIPSTSLVTRLAGANRYETAASVSKADYPNGSNLAYVTGGTAYADSILATQQAATGPLLYASAQTVPKSTIDEIKRLKARRLVIVGGADIVSDAVAQAIKQQTGATVERVSGPNRYDTAVALSKELYPNGTDQVFLARGDAYADSIVASSIPATASVLYVSDKISDSTMTELQRLGATKVTIVGGEIRVSAEVAEQAKQIMAGAAVKQRVKPGVSYVITAHPDDEISAWAISSVSDYPVFVLATQGEASTYCKNHGGKGSQQCRDARVSSWHQFLDNYYDVTDYGMQPDGYHLYKGPDSARVIFDYGDGDLTKGEVLEAITLARQIDYGIVQENYILSGNYWDDRRDPNCLPGKTDYQCGLYDHIDHRIVQNAIDSYSYPNKITFHGSYSPRVTAGAYMNRALFNSMIACPNGTYNQAYSWLNPPCWTRSNSLWHHWQWLHEY